MTNRRAIVAAALVLTLGACNRSADHQAGAGKAAGEVLPASASDAMLPIDTVKSQAPLAPKTEGESKEGAKDATAGKSDQPSDAEAAEPAAAPTEKPDSGQ
jgi:hypothetical protein